MEFRSRGIRFDLLSKCISMKEYYEPTDDLIRVNSCIAELASRMRILEYSINDDGLLDSINFHTSCIPFRDIVKINYSNLTEDNICQVFDETFKAYTLGLRFKNNEVFAVSVYFYPTILKKTRYGISGITDADKIKKQICKLASKLQLDEFVKRDIITIASLAVKFKGIGITVNKFNIASYKLYFRFKDGDFKKLFGTIYDYDKYKNLYGDIALLGLRIENNRIPGYNFYYLR